ncbi:C-C motif chemokine 25 [Latimeria chalumnae]|uniref:C-C motif chemokine 25 n=1 Tax=Latimeria chalumnae TaxID=7897 RepID=UPI0003C17AA6|nr:PREDICTED: C-C motif chemokine 25 [Latimeria chalumnae]|eukprot:XP_005989931.1 PREDICTED: C-C motif chemokine 25 [Latimeria chalumnae]
MKFQLVFLLLILSCFCLSTSQGSYGNCCLGYHRTIKNKIKRRIVSYKTQEVDSSCNITAVQFRLKNTKVVCGNPQDQWVKDMMRKLDAQNQKLNQPKVE